MSNRSRPHILSLRDPQPPLLGPPPPSLHLQSLLASQHRDIHVLLADNQALAATHVALGQELNLARHDLRVASEDAARVEAERERQGREVRARAEVVEVEMGKVERIWGELERVRGDVGELGRARDELKERLEGVTMEVERARREVGYVPEMLAEIEAFKNEIQKGRAAVEYERKAYADNLEQSQVMEKNMVSMGQQIEKLQAELANTVKRARAAAADPPTSLAANPPTNPSVPNTATNLATNPVSGYAGGYGSVETAYGGMLYANAYNMQQQQLQHQQYQQLQHQQYQQLQHQQLQQQQQQPQVPTVAEGGFQYGSGPMSHGHYGHQQGHLPR